MTDGSHFEPLMSCPLAVQPVLYIAGVHLAADAECASEGASPHGEPVALERRMNPCAPARKHGRSIGDDVGIPENDPQK
ncbi:MAG: hypothetical protein K0S05_1059 [Agromyces sp.]|jgi:hypothetical protein|nr:hypothetical protein [Agromyces sp.]